MSDSDKHVPGALNRSLNLPMLTIFGLGTMIGAGIYVLVGEILAITGPLAVWAFVVAAVVAGFTARSYGELAAHYPLSAGEAVYVHRAFGNTSVTALTGWAVVVTGLVSCGALANGFAGYFSVFFPDWSQVAIIGFVIALGSIAIWGIRETVWFAGIVTVLSVAGLIAVVVVSFDYLENFPDVWQDMVPWAGVDGLSILLGAFVAFYAFVGFEDMVNVAEETREPARTMPKAIIWALVIATILYLLVAMVTVLASYELDIAGHSAPLAAMVAHRGPHWAAIIAILSMLSVTNGALAQIVMASRVLYGMANQRHAPEVLSKVHPTRQTPLVATLLVTAAVLVLALWFPLITLAKATSFVILGIFTLVNLALIRLKLAGEISRASLWVPVSGASLSLALILMSLAG